MRSMRMMVAWLGVVSAGAMVTACAPTYTYPKKMKREDAALDVLDCQKAAVLKYKAARLREDASYEERQAAVAAARLARDRCLKARGWQKNE